MKEHPILFSTPMVKAIIENRKTQTRRIIKPQPEITKNERGLIDYTYRKGKKFSSGQNMDISDLNSAFFRIRIYCPYGQPGDLLWVREKWRYHDIFNIGGETSNGEYWYYASVPKIIGCVDGVDYTRDQWRWKPSIHLPKSASRIWLEITNVKVERVQSISEEDAKAEGADKYDEKLEWLTAKHGFQMLWDTIHGKESWDANPWVWVVTFKVLSTTGRPTLNSEL